MPGLWAMLTASTAAAAGTSMGTTARAFAGEAAALRLGPWHALGGPDAGALGSAIAACAAAARWAEGEQHRTPPHAALQCTAGCCCKDPCRLARPRVEPEIVDVSNVMRSRGFLGLCFLGEGRTGNRRFWAASRPSPAPGEPGKGPGRGPARFAPVSAR